MRGLRIASVNLRRKTNKQKIVKNRRNKQYNGPQKQTNKQKIDVVGKKHNNSLNHASKTKTNKHTHTDTVSRITKEDKTNE